MTHEQDVNNYTAFGELLTAQLQPKAAWRFDYGTTPNTRLYVSTLANGGGVSLAVSML